MFYKSSNLLTVDQCRIDRPSDFSLHPFGGNISLVWNLANRPGSLQEGMGFSKLFERHESASSQEVVGGNGDGHTSSTDVSVIHDGGLAYTVAKAENGSKPSWQEAIGAPVESRSPLGYHVGWLTVIFLNVNQMIGTGVFSTRKATPKPGINLILVH